MPRPVTEPIDPAKLPELARGVIRAGKFPLLATMDGDQPRVRPMTLSWEEEFTTYYVSLRRFHKTVELEHNPKVEVCFLDEHHSQVRISGVAEIVADPGLRERAWKQDPLIPRFLGTIGRVPLFYYILHIYLIHATVLAVGTLAGFPPSMFLTLWQRPPEGWGYPLPVVYLVWAGVVLALYPACRWFAAVKARRHEAWLSYL